MHLYNKNKQSIGQLDKKKVILNYNTNSVI